MKAKSVVLCLLTFVLGHSAFGEPLGTAFTYLGRLNNGGNAASGYHDFQFKLFDALASGVQQGSTVVSNAIAVSNGLFTVTLDFGPGVFDGSARWLDITVRTNGAVEFTPLTPRQLLTPTPYALYAPSAGAAATATTAASAQGVTANAITAAGIASGQVVKSLNGLKDVVALAAGPNVTLATNANTLTISAAGGGASGGWTTTGNAGTTPTANFLGTTDGQPLVINAGSVGINTNDPQATLHVNGTVLATQFAGDGSGLANVPATLATPFTLTTLATTNFAGHARGLVISGQYAYVASGYAGLHVYDISDPAHPSHVGPDPSLVWDASAVALSGHYAFVAGDTLRSVDISSPANPVIAGSAPGTRLCYGVAVSGDVAYLAADADGLFTYNIANPTTPVSLGQINNGGHALGVAVSGNFAYLANALDGLRIYHVANPAVPVAIGHRNEGGQAYAIALSGDFAYLANYDDGLRIYNVSNPTNPVSVGHVFDTGYACGVVVSGHYAYVANNHEGLRVYDVSDPAHPTSVGVAPISGGGGVALAVAVAGHYAYTANELGGLVSYFAAPLATVPGVVGATAFLGDGASLTNLNAGQLTGQLAPPILSGLWQSTGNAGTTPGQNFLGTTDNQPLDLRANNQGVLRLEPGGNVAIDPWGNNNGGLHPGLTFGLASREGIASKRTSGDNQFGLDFFTAHKSRMSIDNAGSVHIGGSAPDAILDVQGNTRINDKDIFLRGGSDTNHGVGWYGGSRPFGSMQPDGPVLYGRAGGMLGTTENGALPSLSWEPEGVKVFNQLTTMGNLSVLGDAKMLGKAEVLGDAEVLGNLDVSLNLSAARVGIGTTAPSDGALDVLGDIRINDSKILLRGGSDRSHGLQWTGPGSWGSGWDGPVLHGYSGGVLGTTADGNQYSLIWNRSGSVVARGSLFEGCDRAVKTDFGTVNCAEVLEKVAAMPIQTWRYKADGQELRHLGPFAQDFRAAFGLGMDDKHIAVVDATGVALAAIQGLNQKLEEKETRIKELELRLEKLEHLIPARNGGGQ